MGIGAGFAFRLLEQMEALYNAVYYYLCVYGFSGGGTMQNEGFYHAFGKRGSIGKLRDIEQLNPSITQYFIVERNGPFRIIRILCFQISYCFFKIKPFHRGFHPFT